MSSTGIYIAADGQDLLTCHFPRVSLNCNS